MTPATEKFYNDLLNLGIAFSLMALCIYFLVRYIMILRNDVRTVANDKEVLRLEKDNEIKRLNELIHQLEKDNSEELREITADSLKTVQKATDVMVEVNKNIIIYESRKK